MTVPVIELDTVLEYGKTLLTVICTSGLTYLIFSKTMTAKIRAGFIEEESKYREQLRGDIDSLRKENRECKEEGAKKDHRWMLLIQFLCKQGFQVPKEIMEDMEPT